MTPGAEGPDIQIMDIRKFVKLAIDNNPAVLEILFTDSKHYVRKHPIMDRLIENRHLFLAKSAKYRFSGYALSQLKRIRKHRRWIENPPDHQPTRTEFGLPEHKLLQGDQIGAAENIINNEVNQFMIDQTHLSEDTKIALRQGVSRMVRAVWLAINGDQEFPIGHDKKYQNTDEALFFGAAKSQGINENFMEVLKKERDYKRAKQEWDSYQRWLRERNPKRAELEEKFGFDTKNATHLFRLLRMCREILETGEVIVERPDAKELLEIRDGKMSYEEIVEFAEKEDAELDELMRKSSLPRVPPIKKIDDIVSSMIMEFTLFER